MYVVTSIQNNTILNQHTYDDQLDANAAFFDMITFHENGQPEQDHFLAALEGGLWEHDHGTVTIGSPVHNTKV